MVGIVVVSHSQKLAEGAVELAKLMAGDANIVAAGGLDDGQAGTSFEKIMSAVEEVHEEDGVAVLMDMGSAVMTTEMVIEARIRRVSGNNERQGFVYFADQLQG